MPWGNLLESSITHTIVGELTEHFRRTRTEKSAARPFITLAYAQSLDGSIAYRPDRPLSLSCPDSLQLTHELRAHHDAILVGIQTVLSDDPQLTVRLVSGSDPQPVIVDSQLRLPEESNLLKGKKQAWLAATTGASSERQRHVESCGARVFRLPALPNGWVDLDALMGVLSSQGIEHVLVEGGGRIITSFLSARLADFAVVTVSPRFVGGFSALSPHALTSFPRLNDWRSERFGDDLVVAGALRWDDCNA